MKPLTLTQLRKAAQVVGTHKKFKNQKTGINQALHRAILYMCNKIDNEPIDPRIILTELGYEW